MKQFLDKSRITELLKTDTIGSNFVIEKELDSTNRKGLELARGGAPEGTVVIAEDQRAGRGRLGRKWVSMPGLNLTFSILLRPDAATSRLGILPLLAGVSVAKALEDFVPVPPVCKWPNDVLLNGGKVCGILCESALLDQTCDAVVAGIGINVNQTVFPDGLSTPPTSLALITGTAFELEEVLARVLNCFERYYTLFQEGNDTLILDAWKTSTTMIGSTILVHHHGTPLRGTAVDIGEDGSLMIQSDGLLKRIYAGDITFHGE